MAETTISQENRAQEFDSKVFVEYIRENQYSAYMGADESAAIQINEKLGKMPGDAITIPLVGAMNATNVGTGALEGNEEVIGTFSHKITVEVVRNAFAINNFEEQVSPFDIVSAGRVQLKSWAMDLLRNDINNALHSRNKINYENSTVANHNTWQVDNSDRVIYSGTANSGVHITDLATMVKDVDIFDSKTLMLAKRKAKTATPAIKPIRVNGQEEWYVMFVDTYMFRDLEADPLINQAQQNALERGKNNPLFTAGDIIYRGVIVREVPEISKLIDDAAGLWGNNSDFASLNTAATAGERAGVGFLLGAQAIAIAYAKRLKTTTDTRDYDFIKGFGVQEFRGVEKLLFQSATTNKLDHGVVTVYSAAALD